jgi:thiol-disulfide isomerase/thioredoxin
MTRKIKTLLKSMTKDIVLFFAIIGGIGVVQMFYFQGKDVPPGVLAESYPVLNGLARPLVDDYNYTFVYSFAPWCGVCKMSASNINSLEGHVNTLALALSYEQEADVRGFVNHTGLNVPVILGQGRLEDTLNVGQFPTYFVVDRKGKIVLGWSGYTTTLGLWIRLLGIRLVGGILPGF